LLKGITYRTQNYFRRKGLVLMYHRIGEIQYDPFELVVSPANFEEQLAVLRKKWNPVSLPNLALCVKNQYVVDRSVVVTFDDGYVDNFTEAIPMLEHYNIPATFYITTGGVEKQEPFWWDELQTILLESPVLPETFTVQIGSEPVTVSIEGEAVLTPQLENQHRNWKVEERGIPTRRGQAQLKLWALIRPLIPAEQRAVMTQLRIIAGEPSRPVSPWLGMTPDQIRQIQENPLFTIGAHTHTHPALADHGREGQEREVRQSKQALEALLGKPVTHFSYPYGSHDQNTLAILEQERMETSVTTNEGTVIGISQPLTLNRYQVNNWNGKTFHQKLKWWYTR
jgi:peptidoglycan/xylan/chitin deacetylase (PgdA/CDA1 family)